MPSDVGTNVYKPHKKPVYPPRVRGNPHVETDRHAGGRSIPACAGEPRSCSRTCGIVRVYPRVCGGTLELEPLLGCAQGLSPRVRGNPARLDVGSRHGRSIPACAGEPPGSDLGRLPEAVYPRVCGGTGLTGPGEEASTGLSPRVRGNPTASPTFAGPSGSIPACAGEPGTCMGQNARIRVYPRVCGGTWLS